MKLNAGNGPLIGVIRWDGWTGDLPTFGGGTPYGLHGERCLNPNEFHWRLPFFGREEGPDKVYARQVSTEISDLESQKIMDREIEYAKNSGMDFWAFCWYNDGSGLDKPRKFYLSSKYKNDVNYCLILGGPYHVFSGELDNIIAEMSASNYQKVLNNRPLLYWLKGYGEDIKAEEWAKIRKRCIDKGLENPYIAISGYEDSSHETSKYAKSVGADAIFSYWGAGWDCGYAESAEAEKNMWKTFMAGAMMNGLKFIPFATTGADVRPRILDKEHYGPDKYWGNAYIRTGTPQQIADHIKDTIDWYKTPEGKAVSDANVISIYSWNEFDEGGSALCPSLYFGAHILDALADVLGIECVTSSLTAGTYDDTNNQIVYGVVSGYEKAWKYQYDMPGHGCTGDKVHLSQVQGEYMKFSYTGENAAVYGFKGSSCGSVDLYIDNIRYESINLENGGSLKLTKLFDAKKFVKEGTHVIKLINTDGKKLMIDRVEIK